MLDYWIREYLLDQDIKHLREAAERGNKEMQRLYLMSALEKQGEEDREGCEEVVGFLTRLVRCLEARKLDLTP